MKGRGSTAAMVVSGLLWVSACAGAVLALSGCASCQSTVRQVALPALAAGSFDGVEADQTAHRIYLADRTNNKVAVVDMSSAKPQFVGTIDVVGTTTAVSGGDTLAPVEAIASRELDQFVPGTGFQGAVRMLSTALLTAEWLS